MGALRSNYFEDASYSYQTCEAGGSTSTGMPSTTSTAGADLTKIAETIENYLRADARAVEMAHYSTSSSSRCDSRLFCPCINCEDHDDWHCAGEGGVDLTAGGLFLKETANHNLPEVNRMKCMASAVNSNFLRTVGSESEGDRIGYQYFGDQGSAGLAQWPSVNWCSDTYDPRFRPWYTGSASGPKDVVIVIDTSGSMESNGRISLAKEAAVKVLDTLTWHDHATIVLFDDEAYASSNQLQAMTADVIEELKEYANNNIESGGGTQFDAAFSKAFEVLRSGGPTSACNKVILFMTDGQSSANLPSIRSQAANLGARIFTYALGSGADTTVPKQIACENGGVFHAVSDGSNLGDVMASYYKLFAAGMPKSERCKVRWTDYIDVISGVELLTATMPVYKVASGESMCASDDDGGPENAGDDESLAELLGVVAVDMNVITELEPMFDDPAWDSFWSRILSDSCSCPSISLSHNQLEALRAATPGSQQCGNLALLSAENSPNPPPRPDPASSTCGSGIEPAKGKSACGLKGWMIFLIVVAAGVGCAAGLCCTMYVRKKCCVGKPAVEMPPQPEPVLRASAPPPYAPHPHLTVVEAVHVANP